MHLLKYWHHPIGPTCEDEQGMTTPHRWWVCNGILGAIHVP
jgi:hypothetical protein